MYRRSATNANVPDTNAPYDSVMLRRPSSGLSEKAGSGSWMQSGVLIRVLLVVICVETLYIISGAFSSELICDDLRVSLHMLKKDYDRSQLVIKTLTLSCNEADYESCLNNLDETKKNFFQSRKEHSKQVESLTSRLDRCVSDLDQQLTATARAVRHSKKLQKQMKALEDASEEKEQKQPSEISIDSSPQEYEETTKPKKDPEESPGSAMSEHFEEGESSATWLAIGIPTVPRKSGIDYLSPTLEAILHQLPSNPNDPLFNRIKVIVMNNKPGEHSSFKQNREKFQSTALAEYFDFVDNVERKESTPQTALDQARLFKQYLKNVQKPPIPSANVQQQTRDVVSVLQYAQKSYQPAYYLFMEDDFEICSNGFDAIRYMINRATLFNNDWIAIRASFGLNGIVLHGKDLQTFGTYLDHHQARRPPDHLITEWFAGETVEADRYRGNRTNVGFRYNLFDHLGTVSSIRVQKHTMRFPRCWERLSIGAVFEVEAYKDDICPGNDLWPCEWENKACKPSAQLCLEDGKRVPNNPPPIILWSDKDVDKPKTVKSKA